MVIHEKAKKGVEYCYIIKGKEKCLNLSLFSNKVLNWFFNSRFSQYIEFIEERE